VSRIRSIKPEWLEDELALASLEARVLSVALIVMADDYGNGRAHPTLLASRVFPGIIPELSAKALEELRLLRYVILYDVEGQQYFSIRNWSKHQRVDKPSRAVIPAPPAEDKKKQRKPKPARPKDIVSENNSWDSENESGTFARARDIPTPLRDRKGEEGREREAGAATARPRRWKRIPADWVPNPEDGLKHAERGVDLKLEEEKIRDWEFKDWRTDEHATWRTWLRRADISKPPSNGQSPMVWDSTTGKLVSA